MLRESFISIFLANEVTLSEIGLSKSMSAPFAHTVLTNQQQQLLA